MVTALVAVAAVAVVLAIGGVIGFGWRVGVGIAAGGLVATANLWAFAHIVRGVLGGGKRTRLWGLAGALKFLALACGAYLLLRSGFITGLTLAIGYAALPLGVTLGTLLSPQGDDDEGPSSGPS